MRTHDNGGQAFPLPYTYAPSGLIASREQTGMTLRDYFAAKAMQGLWANAEVVKRMSGLDEHGFAKMAYEQADAMLKARGGAQ